LLTPAIVAGVIADEKQRKTLQYLLTSRLSTSEIVLGKLAARLLHVGVFLAIGVPVLSLLSLFGGVDPVEVLLAFAATIAGAYFLACLAILVSTHARRAREAISLCYLLVLFWLFVPSLITFLRPQGGIWQTIFEWFEPLNDLVVQSSPIYFLY